VADSISDEEDCPPCRSFSTSGMFSRKASCLQALTSPCWPRVIWKQCCVPRSHARTYPSLLHVTRALQRSMNACGTARQGVRRTHRTLVHLRRRGTHVGLSCVSRPVSRLDSHGSRADALHLALAEGLNWAHPCTTLALWHLVDRDF